MRDSKYIQRSYPEFPNNNQVLATYQTDEDKNMGKHYVMWSGGTDSTLLLYELLDAYGSDNVVAVSYKYPWLFNVKWETEKKHRDAFKAKMAIRGNKYANFKHIELGISTNETVKDKPVNANNSGGLPQAVAWLLSVPMYCEYHSYVYDGSIRNDDLTLVIDGYHKMFEGISETLNKKIILREPYIYFSKSQILQRLFKYDLYEETWHCELPPDICRRCNKCVPCKTHFAALTELSLSCDDEYVKMKAKRELDKIVESMNETNDKDTKKEPVNLIDE